MLSEKMANIYRQLSFFERYLSLSEKHRANDRLERLDNEFVLNIFSELGYTAKYWKKENFYGIKEIDENFDFRFNFSLKYGLVEPIMYAKNLKTGEQVDGTLAAVCQIIQLNAGIARENLINIPYPRFASYEELKEILSELFSMYKNFKEGLLNDYWNN